MTRLLALLAAAAALGGAVRAASSKSPAGLPEGPIAPCRDADGSRRCYRDRRAFAAPPERVFAAAARALPALRGLSVGTPAEVASDPDARTLTATYRVAFYHDRVRVAVEPDGAGGAVLWARSRSRTWGQDFGVNRRRVRTLFAAVERALA